MIDERNALITNVHQEKFYSKINVSVFMLSMVVQISRNSSAAMYFWLQIQQHYNSHVRMLILAMPVLNIAATVARENLEIFV